jgi:hypothetical protein
MSEDRKSATRVHYEIHDTRGGISPAFPEGRFSTVTAALEKIYAAAASWGSRYDPLTQFERNPLHAAHHLQIVRVEEREVTTFGPPEYAVRVEWKFFNSVGEYWLRKRPGYGGIVHVFEGNRALFPTKRQAREAYGEALCLRPADVRGDYCLLKIVEVPGHFEIKTERTETVVS